VEDVFRHNEDEDEVEGDDDGGDEEVVEAQHLGVAQPQDIEEVAEYDDEDDDDIDGEEEGRRILKSYHPRVSSLRPLLQAIVLISTGPSDHAYRYS
jgi:hypothetical protein